MSLSPPRRLWPRRPRYRIAIVAGGLAAALAILLTAAGFFDSDPITFFAAQGARRPVGAVYFSGDMGLRFGMGPPTSRLLATHGIAVTGVSSSTLFAMRRTRADVDGIVADAVRAGVARTGSDRVVLIGQSYGADILQTGLADLPADLRRHVAAVILVVPGQTVFFRADPSGLAYRGTPDSLGATTVNRIDWVPLTCIYGAAETDSLCPAVRLARATVVRMPGGHFLANDSAGLGGQVLAAIRRAVPGFDKQGTR